MNESDCNGAPLLEVCDLRTSFFTDRGVVRAVDGVSLRIPYGQTVAIVGESGCGKSVTGLSILRLIPQPPGKIVGGRILLAQPGASRPVDVLLLSDNELRMVRGRRIAMIFQEPMTSLNPVYSVGEQIVEAIELHQPLRGRAAWQAAVEMLRTVGIQAPSRRAHDYPHQLSGGMCQRVMIAMALSCQPSLLIADEPTTALDVTVQLQILHLLRSLQRASGMSILLITHDLGVVAEAADYVYVMYAGRIVEHGAVTDVLARPLHPYTRGLLGCVPRLSDSPKRLEAIPGAVPDPIRFPRGCRFHPRCRVSAEAAGSAGRKTIRADSELGDRVLARCVESHSEGSASALALREVRRGHFVTCVEAAAQSDILGPARLSRRL